jgi:hypothetical protein
MYVLLREPIPLLVAAGGWGKLFGPVPFPFAVATNSFPPEAGESNAIEIGIHSVGTNPIGSTIPAFDAFAVSLRVSNTATASLPMFAAYNRLPFVFTASPTGSAPK